MIAPPVFGFVFERITLTWSVVVKGAYTIGAGDGFSGISARMIGIEEVVIYPSSAIPIWLKAVITSQILFPVKLGGLSKLVSVNSRF